MVKPRKLAIIASHVIQYQDPFFRRLAADAAIDVTVFYCSRAGADGTITLTVMSFTVVSL